MQGVRASPQFKEEAMRLLNISQVKGDFQIHFQKCLAHPVSSVGASQDTAAGCQSCLRTVDLQAASFECGVIYVLSYQTVKNVKGALQAQV